jgi:tRNA(His) 5'-end guanylyltransferase
MKCYENVTRTYLPRRTYTLIRVDGKSFHSFTRGCEKPFDHRLMGAMDFAAEALCTQLSGARIGFVQSDEISILLTDFDALGTQPYFGGNLQKICSISASAATAAFGMAWNAGLEPGSKMQFPLFDARVWIIPDPAEVANYFVWRQQDATRNSIHMLASSYFSHSQLMNKSTADMQDMLMGVHGVNWNDCEVGEKRGRAVIKERYTADIEGIGTVERKRWAVVEPPIFTQDRQWLLDRIPVYDDQSS